MTLENKVENERGESTLFRKVNDLHYAPVNRKSHLLRNCLIVAGGLGITAAAYYLYALHKIAQDLAKGLSGGMDLSY
ncbi:MAG: hypothetical protein AABX90_00170 [Nanoarchaeota archaeon]